MITFPVLFHAPVPCVSQARVHPLIHRYQCLGRRCSNTRCGLPSFDQLLCCCDGCLARHLLAAEIPSLACSPTSIIHQPQTAHALVRRHYSSMAARLEGRCAASPALIPRRATSVDRTSFCPGSTGLHAFFLYMFASAKPGGLPDDKVCRKSHYSNLIFHLHLTSYETEPVGDRMTVKMPCSTPSRSSPAPECLLDDRGLL
ncbi:hypothetical protein B0H21DRAFT_546171 [Amylocystis lapponica]|nr:hypothetical protein B0H21DRAFT_546171 [Amylocystis lapponica]